jgi:hypothetical protein
MPGTFGTLREMNKTKRSLFSGGKGKSFLVKKNRLLPLELIKFREIGN